MAATPHLSLDRKIAGVLIPVFALRSAGDQGIGDTGALRRFIDWAARAGFGLVQLLPINETGGDNSPYNAISSVALDPATLETTPSAIPDLTDADVAAVDAERGGPVRADGPIQYARVKPYKLALLRRAFANFQDALAGAPERMKAFVAFCERNDPWLADYTQFRALMERHGNTECWDQWPANQQTAAAAQKWERKLTKENAEAFAREKSFFAYVQWLAYGQWEALKNHAGALGVALMGDIPLGVSYYSADYFSHPEQFEQGWSGGAPPEPYFKDDAFTQKWGQNWGIPVYDWAEMRKDDFRWWRQRIGGVRDIFHVFRIDHILGFYRIYSFPWRPERNAEFLPLSADEARARAEGRLPRFKPQGDDSWEERQANCAGGDALLRMILAAAGETRLIGEDLGVVPDYVRPNLTSLGIAGFKIPIWEPDPRTGGLMPGGDYPRLSLVTYGTHDHEPLVAFWRRAQSVPPDQRHELANLLAFAGLPPDDLTTDFCPRIHTALLDALFRSNSWIAVCMITDLFAREERFNVPGTAAESNWSRRMHVTVEALDGNPELQAFTVACRTLLAGAGRDVPN